MWSTLAVIGDTVYAGGRFTSVSGVPPPGTSRRSTPATGSRRSGTPARTLDVLELRVTSAGLLVHGEFAKLGGVPHQGLGLFPLARSGDARLWSGRRVPVAARSTG